MTDIRSILKQYWGYDAFRPLQEDIIQSVLSGNDTLALLPTGGGKSICFQVPAMAHDGICIVVSPLIALMKDQVENLNRRGIKSIAIYSGMPYRQINYLLDNCIHGDFKFLYVSPERLKTSLFRERLKRMKVNLLAVDEAHCISQWGYDFRPEYLQIAEIRDLLPPKVPILALTASATELVVNDIQEKLAFKRNNVFLKSFTRPNISYVVNETEDKLNRMLHIINKVPGTGLVYVRNRRQTQEIAAWLRKQNIQADFYHAGLTHEQRNSKQEAWIKNHIRMMVCTNAFGMGIDKPDVRLVIHYEMPDSLESYYQEAGRAGRDEKKSYCVLLYNQTDKQHSIDKLNAAYPPTDVMVRTYQSLCNYFSIPVGDLPDRSFDLDIKDVCEKFKLNAIEAYNSIKLLHHCEVIYLTENFFEPSKVKITVPVDVLYRFQVENSKFDPFLKLLLRSYGGTFDNYVNIDENVLAKRGKTDANTIKKYFQKLHSMQLLEYLPQTDKPQIHFQFRRYPVDELKRALLKINERKAIVFEKMQSLIGYAENLHICRSRKIVGYFNEYTAPNCGVCDVCIAQKKIGLSEERFLELIDEIKKALIEEPLSIKNLAAKLLTFKNEDVAHAVSYLLDSDKLHYNSLQLLEWRA